MKREAPMNWLEQQFHDLSWLMLILLTLLFFFLMWIFSGLALLVSRNRIARTKAAVIFTFCSVEVLGITMLAVLIAHAPKPGALHAPVPGPAPDQGGPASVHKDR